MIVTLLLGPGLTVLADDDAPALVRPQRLVHRFDFEERELGNYESMPMNWYAIGRPARTTVPNFENQPLHRELLNRTGYPAFAELGFDTAHARTDEHSFGFALNGGNVGAFLEVGTLPAVPGSDYLITAELRTEDLARAGALVRAYFIDDAGRRIDASLAESRRVRTDGRWVELAVSLRGDFPDAAWIGLELKLAQPTPTPHHPLGAHEVVLRDVHGRAWFDNVTIWHVPHLEVRTPSRVNIIRAPAEPELTVDIRDLTGRPLAATLDVYDHRRQLVDTHAWTFSAARNERSGFTPELPGYGWYLLDVAVRDVDDAEDSPYADDRPIARTLAALLYLPAADELPRDQARRFSLIAEDVSVDEVALVPELLTAVGLRRVVLSAFDSDTTAANLEARLDLIERVAQRAMLDRDDLSLSLHPMPETLLSPLGDELRHPLTVLATPADAWVEQLTPVLMRLGEQTGPWHLAAAGDDEAYYMPELEATLEHVRRQFQSLVSQPRFVLPWRVDQPRRAGLPEGTQHLLELDPALTAEALPEALAPWADHADQSWLLLREMPADAQGHAQRVASLAHRMVAAWRTDPAGLALAGAWTTGDTRQPSLAPDPLLGAYSQIARHLAGRRFIGELPLGPAQRGLIAQAVDGPGPGMLVAWNRSAPPEQARIDMDLGGSPQAYDVWGNPVAVERVDGRHRVALGDKPLFILGIDPALAMFRAGFAIDDPAIESTQQGHRRTLRITNPFDQTLTGHLRFTGPDDWDIQPAHHSFAIPAGGEIELPITIRFPITETAGQRSLVARFDMTADDRYQVDVSVPVELGLTGLEFDASVQYLPRDAEPGAYDALVTCFVTNVDRRAGGYAIFANMPGHPRQERLIPRLQRGESVIRRFRFERVDPNAGLPIRVGARETAGPAILNQIIE